jgi:hypothetical protein
MTPEQVSIRIMKFGALWALFALLAGAEKWKFPASIRSAWKLQKELSGHHWTKPAESKIGRDKITFRSKPSI